MSTVTNASTQFRDEDQRSSSELLNCLQGRTMMEFRASLPWSLISAKLPTSGKGRPGRGVGAQGQGRSLEPDLLAMRAGLPLPNVGPGLSY